MTVGGLSAGAKATPPVCFPGLGFCYQTSAELTPLVIVNGTTTISPVAAAAVTPISQTMKFMSLN